MFEKLKSLPRGRLFLVSLLIVIGIMYSMELLHAPSQVLEDVVVFEEKGRTVLQVRFSTPVRYENHFPANKSDFLQIKVRTVALLGTGDNEYLSSDNILPGFLEKVPVAEVAFEGDVPGGPFVSLRFREPLRYQVAEDPSLRGINIIVVRDGSRGAF